MKCKDFYDEVALLGFETDIDEEATFYPALNTALRSVLREVPTIRSALLAHNSLNPLVSETNTTISGGEGISFKAEGAKSFFIELAGKANVTFKMYDADDIEIPNNLNFENNTQSYRVTRCFLPANARVEISITAQTLCKLKAFALYRDTISDNKDDIQSPVGYVIYDLSKICEAFGELYYPPKYEDGNSLYDYVIEGNILKLPRGADGDIVLAYTPLTPTYSEDTQEAEIAIHDNYLGALKYLVASLVWLDDNASRAKYYKSLYNEEIALIKRSKRDLNPLRHEIL